MTKNKKLLAMIVSAIMVVAMVLSLGACSKGNTNSGDNNSNTNNTNNTGNTGAADGLKTKIEKWDSVASGKAKSATDDFSVVLSIPMGEDSIDLTLEARLVREYDGSDISKIEGYLTYVGVSGAISDMLSGIKGVAADFDLNKLIKTFDTEKFNDEGEEKTVTYYKVKGGKKLYEWVEDGETTYTWSLSNYKALTEDELAAVQYEYLTLYENGAISFGTPEVYDVDKALAGGTFTVTDGAFSVEGGFDIPGLVSMKTEEPVAVPSDIMNMDRVESLMDQFDVKIDFDALNILDLTKGTVTESTGKYTVSKLAFATAVSAYLSQIDALFDSFMEGGLTETMINVFNGFVENDEDKVTLEVGEQKINEVIDMIEIFEDVLEGEKLSDMLFSLVDMKASNHTVSYKSDKITEISGSQKGTLTITDTLIDSVIDTIDRQELIKDEEGKAQKLNDIVVVDSLKLTVGKIKNLAITMLFEENDDEVNELNIGITVNYKTHNIKY
jgi:hypothetical protein